MAALRGKPRWRGQVILGVIPQQIIVKENIYINALKTTFSVSNIIYFVIFFTFLASISPVIDNDIITKIFSYMSFIALGLSTPIILGIFTEVINKQRTSISSLFKHHFVNYLLFKLIIFIPILIFSLISIITNTNSDNIHIKLFLYIALDILFIYSLPMLFETKKVKKSIINGLKFLFKHYDKSHVLILLVFFSNSFFIFISKGFFSESTHPVILMQFSYFVVRSVLLLLSFYVFCLSLLILKKYEV